MFDGTYHVILTIIGIGFIIFVHELGHYLAARAVGIRVEAFAIGFGPRLFGWTRGTCEYKLCAIPLGGYVKMAGEDPTRPTTGQPDEFGSKKVWQRMLVISAGVIMNMIFALIAVPIAFSFGVPFEDPVIGVVQPGSPAWEAGLRSGDRVLQIEGRKVLGFGDILQDVAVADGTISFKIERGDQTMDLPVTPRDWLEKGMPQIGVSIACNEFRTANPEEAKELDGDQRAAIDALAEAGVTGDHSILAINGVPLSNQYWMRQELQRAGVYEEPLVFTVRGKDGVKDISIAPSPAEEKQNRLGIGRGGPQVRAVRAGSQAANVGLKPGDLVRTIDGKTMAASTDLPRLLGEGTNLFSTSDRPAAPGQPKVVLFVATPDLDGDTETVAGRTIAIDLPDWESRRALVNDIAWDHIDGRSAWVHPGTPAAESGLQTGDLIVSVNGKTYEGLETISESYDATIDDQKPLSFVVLRPDGRHEIQITPRKLRKNVYGKLALAMEIPRSPVTVPVGESIQVGITHTGRLINRVISTLRSLFRGSVSPKHLGGIITIFQASKQTSKISPMRLLLFLAMVSINLAILNILPIPVLDGGWLVFLIIEKIKGSPITEKTMAYFQWAGLIFILSLMAYVTWNDIQRLITGS